MIEQAQTPRDPLDALAAEERAELVRLVDLFDSHRRTGRTWFGVEHDLAMELGAIMLDARRWLGDTAKYRAWLGAIEIDPKRARLVEHAAREAEVKPEGFPTGINTLRSLGARLTAAADLGHEHWQAESDAGLRLGSLLNAFRNRMGAEAFEEIERLVQDRLGVDAVSVARATADTIASEHGGQGGVVPASFWAELERERRGE